MDNYKGSADPAYVGDTLTKSINLTGVVEEVIEAAQARWPGVKLQVEVGLGENLVFTVKARPTPAVQ